MKIVVGLGNPESKYDNTFHNLGFCSIDKLAVKLGLTFSAQKFQGVIAETKIRAEKIILLKPTTYMNLSGKSVKEVLDFYKVESKDLLVIVDDFDLPKGQIRVREEGSAGTHNGLKSIIAELGTEKFTRVRVGFKPSDDNKIPLIDLVLSKISEQDKPLLAEATLRASQCAYDFINGEKIDILMQKYNGKAKQN